MIIDKSFSVKITPNSATNEVVGFDESIKAYRVRIKAPARDNKANKELVRFLSKIIGKKVMIKSGLKRRVKRLIVAD